MSGFPIETVSEEKLLPFLAEKIAQIGDAAVAAERPVFLHTLGVPGAGKSSIIPGVRKALGADACTYVAFDSLMESIPAYQNETDREKAFKQFELPARAAGYCLLKKLVEKRASVFLEHGGSYAQHIDMLRYASEVKGYKVILVHISTSAEVAKKRVALRQEKEGRHTPLTYIDQRYAIVKELIPAYQEVADSYFDIPNNDEWENPQERFAADAEIIARTWKAFAA